MAKSELEGMRVALLVTDGFEQVEMTGPRIALQRAGAHVVLVAPGAKHVLSFDHHDKAKSYDVDVRLEDAKANDYDALVLPGGVMSPDALRMNSDAVAFVRNFVEERKPIAAICHGPWTLLEAGGIKGKTLTSWPSLKTDIENAGGIWIDQSVVADGNLVTSRNPDDLPNFNDRMLTLFSETMRSLASQTR